jgi:hypothetical protein
MKFMDQDCTNENEESSENYGPQNSPEKNFVKIFFFDFKEF